MYQPDQCSECRTTVSILDRFKMPTSNSFNAKGSLIKLRRWVKSFISLFFPRFKTASDKNHALLTAEDFDSPFYLRRYPDVAAAGVDPYQHYLHYGSKEGRLPRSLKLHYSGGIEQRVPARKSVLVVSHEASRSGAPILSLNIAQELGKKYNVITLLLGGGPLVENFRDASDMLIGPEADGGNQIVADTIISQLLALHEVDFAIVNSIESRSVLPELARRFVPAVVLIHEFAAYTRPKGAVCDAVFWSAEAVFSAPITLDNAVFEHPELAAKSLHVIPQGRCILPAAESSEALDLAEERRVKSELRPSHLPADTIVILGAGSVQLRKGVDLFVDCAAKVLRESPDKNFRFVWVGKGYDPERDLHYSVYLEDQIRRSGLQNHMHFIHETSKIEVAYTSVDLMVLSSRLDPLPNVAIDAMAHGVPIVCFDKTTGIGDVLKEHGLGDDCVVPYLDTSKMAIKVMALMQSKTRRKEIGEKLKQAAIDAFDMPRYVKQLEVLGTEYASVSKREQESIRTIAEAALARPDFYLNTSLANHSPDDTLRFYVRSWASGLSRRKLFPGFHPGIFQEHHAALSQGEDPLAAFLRAGKPAGPWVADVITAAASPEPIAPGCRIALHLHAYYPELLPDILTRLNSNRVRPDLFVSVPTEGVRAEVLSLLSGYTGKVVEVRHTPNVGRDIGPFLTAFGQVFVGHYDLVGHLHTKKTVDVKDEAIGKRWNRFLLENLLGDKHGMADVIVGRMAADPSIGVVFPDDPNVVGWGDNRPYAEAIAARLGLKELPEHFNFPVGNMFWARVHAIRPLFDLHLEWNDYPQEPLPYDGSSLHAIERLLTFVAAEQGTRLVLTNVSGVTR